LEGTGEKIYTLIFSFVLVGCGRESFLAGKKGKKTDKPPAERAAKS
jgi:hypothetical protein